MLNIGGKEQIFPIQPTKCTGQSVAKERKQRENVAMTVLTSRNGTDHPLVRYLPEFTCSKDKAVVLNLLCNVSGLCVDGYKDVSCRSQKDIQLLVEGCVRSSVAGQWHLSLDGLGLFAVDLDNLLLPAFGALQGQGVPSEIIVRWELVHFVAGRYNVNFDT